MGWEYATAPGRDHPRSRGVYSQVGALMIWRLGSSPLARGLRRLVDAGHHGFRIIPARAGFTPALAPPSSPRPDHPRSRGVYRCSHSVRPSPAGSSPLARGLHHAVSRVGDNARIIPARAGFTGDHLLRRHDAPDHPRSRGVYLRKALDGVNVEGSSPLARGLRGELARLHRVARIIPARAGFTFTNRCRPYAEADHPRSRGVYYRCWRTTAGMAGSSPLARGLPP